MKFKTAFISKSPDADPERHRSLIETEKMKLFVVVVKSAQQAAEVARKLVTEENLHSVLLCPGFAHKEVAEMQEACGPNVSVSVARGDGPGNRVIGEVFRQAGWH
jgi:stalled ribosome rescue protein Dom34